MKRPPRFPPLRRDAHGKMLCRGCGGAVPHDRRTWCSQECKERNDPSVTYALVRVRDRGVCALCGLDTEGLRRRLWSSRHESLNSYDAVLRILRAAGWPRIGLFRKRLYEIDHIIPFCQGGSHAPENLRTLCIPCHRRVTREQRKRKS